MLTILNLIQVISISSYYCAIQFYFNTKSQQELPLVGPRALALTRGQKFIKKSSFKRVKNAKLKYEKLEKKINDLNFVVKKKELDPT